MALKRVLIDSAGRLFLDGEELPGVTDYYLKYSADNGGMAELLVKILVATERVVSGSEE